MKKQYFLVLTTLFFSFGKAQTWKTLIKEDFGYQNTQNTRSQTPTTDLSPGTTQYILVTDNSMATFGFPDGNAMVGSSSMAPRNAATQSASFISGALDHTVDTDNPINTYGNLFAINANPAKQGETDGSYYLYKTSIFDIPGAQYRVSFWGANLLKFATPGKDGYIGLALRDNNNTLYGSGSWTLPKTTLSDATGNASVLPWIQNNINFIIPTNYSANSISFNFYNSDTNSSTSGNDLALDDIQIEMLVVEISGKVFVDINSDGVQQGTEINYNGQSTTRPLYVYVVKSNNLIVSKTQVSTDGTYSFKTDTGVPYSTSDIGLKIIISADNLNAGSTLTTSYVINKATVSENISTSNNPTYFTTGTVDGSIAIKNSGTNSTNVNFGVKPFCYKPAVTTGTVLDTRQGITTLNRAGTQAGNWPMTRKGAWSVLESKSQGFVINRVPTTVSLSNITSPIEGMMVYDEEVDCLKIYTSKNGTTFDWYCLAEQTCPED